MSLISYPPSSSSNVQEPYTSQLLPNCGVQGVPAAFLLQPVVGLSPQAACGLHSGACLGLGCIRGVLRFLDLAYQELEGLRYVLVVPCACFGPTALAPLRHLSALLRAHLALLRAEIALVTHNHNGDGIGTLNTTRWKLVSLHIPSRSSSRF